MSLKSCEEIAKDIVLEFCRTLSREQSIAIDEARIMPRLISTLSKAIRAERERVLPSREEPTLYEYVGKAEKILEFMGIAVFPKALKVLAAALMAERDCAYETMRKNMQAAGAVSDEEIEKLAEKYTDEQVAKALNKHVNTLSSDDFCAEIFWSDSLHEAFFAGYRAAQKDKI